VPVFAVLAAVVEPPQPGSVPSRLAPAVTPAKAMKLRRAEEAGAPDARAGARPLSLFCVGMYHASCFVSLMDLGVFSLCLSLDSDDISIADSSRNCC
jgi:hypothetical protein